MRCQNPLTALKCGYWKLTIITFNVMEDKNLLTI
jgi:hypothetical protein